MSDPAKPAWPDPSALPFMMFGAQAPSPSPAIQPLAQGMDLFKQFWANLPGGNALPGFLVPTVDVEELDKRLSDLRAAEKWLEVNHSMLRATIQGLEVQRNTIAALNSLSTMAEKSFAATPAVPDLASAGWPTGWTAAESVPDPAPSPVPAAPVAPADDAAAAHPLAGLAANHWLGFLQDQFSKVAQAALAGTPATAVVPKATARKAGARPSAKSAAKSAAKRAKRRPASKKA